MQPEGFSMLTSIDLSAVHCTDFVNHRHSGESRNPDKKIILRSRQNQGFVPLRGEFLIHLDSGLLRNDEATGFECCRQLWKPQ
jgi:hypothetical protein